MVVGGSRGEIREYERICSEAGVARLRALCRNAARHPALSLVLGCLSFPSRYESFSLVCFQAAAAGLPLIATRVYGIDELMIDGKTGWIVERSPKAIAFAIAQALHNRPQLAAMGETARQRSLEYGDEQFCARWRALLEQMWAAEEG